MTTPNSIGTFQIGVSQIGDIPDFDIHSTVISQYANSPILLQLIENMGVYFDQTKNLENFFDYVWNIDTAIGPFLDLWGRVVGVQRVIPVVATTKYLGFEEAGVAHSDSFGHAPLYGGQKLTSNYALSDDSYRKLIMIKAAFNLTDCTIPSLNTMLLSLFPNRGKCFVSDNLNMSMTYTFQFSLTPVEQSIVVSSGVLPRPSGVSVSYSY